MAPTPEPTEAELAEEAPGDQAALRARLAELLLVTPDLGYRAAHGALQDEEAFKGVGLKRVQRVLRELRDAAPPAAAAAAVPQSPPPPAAEGGGGAAEPPGGGGGGGAAADPAPPAAAADRPEAAAAAAAAADGPATGAPELTVTRPDLDHKFGMLISTARGPAGGHAVTEIRPGGVIEKWNQSHPESAIRIEDVILAVNDKTSFEAMMDEFRNCLSCTLRVARGGRVLLTEDVSEATKEAAAWEQRKARVTAALIPGLKKIVESEFGPGAGSRIGRVEQMYQRIGRNEVYEEDTPMGRRYAPGYIEGLDPVRTFHDPQDHPWCAELRAQWRAIREELHSCLDESLWTAGAYQKSNEAYGKDWKIMGVLTSDEWQDEVRFKVTTNVAKQLKGVKLFEVFFARMPPHTKIAPHSDNLSYVLTSHLALDLEEGTCSITVGNDERYWKEGEMLILDTTFIHSTKNESARPRYILVLRFWHPGLTEEERRALHVSHAILARTGEKPQ